MNMEIELRAKIEDVEKVRGILDSLAKHKNTLNEDDLYLRHEADVNRSLVLRIRRRQEGALLTFKGKAKGDDTAWPDVDLPLMDPDDLQNLLLGSSYVPVVEIKKYRSSYDFRGFEVNLDEIENLGTFIEIEGRGEEGERKMIEDELMKTLIELGVKESDIVRKGYVALMLERQSI